MIAFNNRWESILGPQDGSRYIDVPIQCPLEMSWELPVTGRGHDGTCIGGDRLIAIVTRDGDLAGVNTLSGKVLWELSESVLWRTLFYLGRWIITYSEFARKWLIIDKIIGEVQEQKCGIVIGYWNNYIICEQQKVFDIRNCTRVEDTDFPEFSVGKISGDSFYGMMVIGSEVFSGCYSFDQREIIWRNNDKSYLNRMKCVSSGVVTRVKLSNFTGISCSTGEKLWEITPYSKRSVDHYATADGKVYYRHWGRGLQQVLTCIDIQTGEKIWERETPPVIYSREEGPFLSPGLIWQSEIIGDWEVDNYKCKAVARCQENGEIVWEKELPKGGHIQALIDGCVIVHIEAGRKKIQCFKGAASKTS